MTRTRYTTVAIVLHWTIAALIVTNLYLGWRMGFLKGLAQFNLFQLHKSVGVTILLLSVLRLVWRLVSPPPELPPSLQPWERAASTAVHWAFYVIMIGMPLSGWIVVSTSPLNIPTLLYHLVPWPHFPGVHDLAAPARKAVNHAFGVTHMTLAFGALVLLALHLGAVAKHEFVDRKRVLPRMLPFAGRASHLEP
jgi:cytochrome b561